MKKFEIGKTYTCKSVGDHNCVWEYTVIERTKKTITVTDGTKTAKFRIIKGLSEHHKAESVYPNGKHSLAPILSADNELGA